MENVGCTCELLAKYFLISYLFELQVVQVLLSPLREIGCNAAVELQVVLENSSTALFFSDLNHPILPTQRKQQENKMLEKIYHSC